MLSMRATDYLPGFYDPKTLAAEWQDEDLTQVSNQLLRKNLAAFREFHLGCLRDGWQYTKNDGVSPLLMEAVTGMRSHVEKNTVAPHLQPLMRRLIVLSCRTLACCHKDNRHPDMTYAGYRKVYTDVFGKALLLTR